MLQCCQIRLANDVRKHLVYYDPIMTDLSDRINRQDTGSKPRRFLKATIQDVAEKAGVSRTTVSHFISGNKRACSPETAERIQTAIDALRYAPAVRGSRHRPARAIGVCVESVANFDEHADQRHSYMERIWSAIIREADVAGYTLLHYPAAVRHSANADAFLNGSIDGLLIGTRLLDARLDAVVDAGLPTVLLNRNVVLPPGFGAVCIDESTTMDLALSHLHALGHRRIAHLAGPVAFPLKGYVPPTAEIAARRGDAARLGTEPGSAGNPFEVEPSDPATRRCETYIAWMEARGLYDPALVGFGGSWLATDLARIERIVWDWLHLDAPPTAIVCANDDLALAILRVAADQGRHVPEDLSVIGIDNLLSAAEYSPALTSVDIPAEQLGRQALRLLLRLLEGKETEPVIVVPATQLMVRASTAAPKQADILSVTSV